MTMLYAQYGYNGSASLSIGELMSLCSWDLYNHENDKRVSWHQVLAGDSRRLDCVCMLVPLGAKMEI